MFIYHIATAPVYLGRSYHCTRVGELLGIENTWEEVGLKGEGTQGNVSPECALLLVISVANKVQKLVTTWAEPSIIVKDLIGKSCLGSLGKVPMRRCFCISSPAACLKPIPLCCGPRQCCLFSRCLLAEFPCKFLRAW